MQVLKVKISGKFAHFRKVISNSTSLSYFFPPRTTAIGILAAAMGLERDSYYGMLAPSGIQVGIEAATPLRKLTMTENFLNTDAINEKNLRGAGNRVQITREYVVSAKGDFLSYNLYYYPINNEMYSSFKSPRYPISLGPANMLAFIEDVEKIDCEIIDDLSNISVSGAIRDDVDVDESEGAELIRESDVPREFINERRSAGKLVNYIFPVNAKNYRIISGKAKSAIIEGKAVPFL